MSTGRRAALAVAALLAWPGLVSALADRVAAPSLSEAQIWAISFTLSSVLIGAVAVMLMLWPSRETILVTTGLALMGLLFVLLHLRHMWQVRFDDSELLGPVVGVIAFLVVAAGGTAMLLKRAVH